MWSLDACIAPECGERTDRTQESHGPRVSRGHGGSRSGLKGGVKHKKIIHTVTGVGSGRARGGEREKD